MRRGEWWRHGDAWFAGGGAVLLLLPLLLPLATGRVFTRDDFAALHLPFRYLYQEALHTGQWLLWTPAYHSGFFLFGAGEAGMAHPLHVALYRVLPLGPAFNLEIILNYVALFAGTALLWRRLGLSGPAALVGGWVLAFGGFTIFNAMHVNHIGTLAHLPWILLATDILVWSSSARGRAVAFAGLAAAVGLQLLAGNPQYVWLTGVAVLALLVWAVLRGAPLPAIGRTLAAFACGGMLGAIQLAPTLEFLRDSTRAAWTGEAAMAYSLSPWNLLQLWTPFAFEFRVVAPPAEEFQVHEFVVYNGTLASAAVFLAIGACRTLPHQPLLRALLIFGAINMVLALGHHGLVYPFLADLPGVGSLRAPARHLVLVHLAMSGLAAILVDHLRGRRHHPACPWHSLWPLWLLLGLSLTTTVAAAQLAGSDWAVARQLRFSPLVRSLPWTVMVAAVIGVVMLAARGRQWALPALFLMAAVDLGLWGYSYQYRWGPIRTIEALKADATAPPDGVPGDVIPTFVGGRDAYAILEGFRLTMGYTGLYARQVLDPRSAVTERLAGLTWTGDGERWQRVDDALPRVRLIASSVVTTDPRSLVGQIDPRVVALVAEPIDLEGPPGRAELLSEVPGQFRVRTDTGGRQLLVLTERFHRGWRATIDGEPGHTVAVYGDFLAVLVPAGRHLVELTFLPDSVRLGRWISAVGLVLVLAIAARFWRGGDAEAPHPNP